MILVGDEMEDGHIAGLAVAVDPAVALQVQAFCCRIGGHQKPHLMRGVVEPLLDVAAADIVHATEERQHAVVTKRRGQAAHNVVERGLVLGEHDEAFVIEPVSLCPQQSFDEPLKLRVARVGQRVDLGHVAGSLVESQTSDCGVEPGDLGLERGRDAFEPTASLGLELPDELFVTGSLVVLVQTQ